MHRREALAYLSLYGFEYFGTCNEYFKSNSLLENLGETISRVARHSSFTILKHDHFDDAASWFDQRSTKH